jgi:hypothetical protein
MAQKVRAMAKLVTASASPAANMPLTKKGKTIMKNMVAEYGPKKAKEVFYASANKGRIKGIDYKRKTHK